MSRRKRRMRAGSPSTRAAAFSPRETCVTRVLHHCAHPYGASRRVGKAHPAVPSTFTVGLCLAFFTLVGAGGCQLMVNPFVDELAGQERVTTASASRARAADVTPQDLRRQHDTMELTIPDSAVTHGPLYFEDPFVSQGSEDGRFIWNGEDLLSFFYGPARFMVNAAFFPVSAVVAPPWTVMASEARTGRKAVRVVRDADRSPSTPGAGG